MIQIGTFGVVHLLEVAFQRLWREYIAFMVAQNGAHGGGQLGQLRRRFPIRALKYEDLTVCQQTSAFTVATACSLGNRVQPRFSSVHRRKVHIHPCFNQ